MGTQNEMKDSKLNAHLRKTFAQLLICSFQQEKNFSFSSLKIFSSVLSVAFAQQIFWNKLRIDHKRLDEHDMNDGLFAFKSVIICWVRLIEADFFFLRINHLFLAELDTKTGLYF